MFKDLYKFSSKSWHARLFKWIYGVSPRSEFSTMCPYFWSMVFTFIFIVPILLIKLTGKYGTKLLDNARTYQSRKRIEKRDAFFAEAEALELEPAICLAFIRRRCWKKFSDYMDWPIRSTIYDTASKEKLRLKNLAYEKQMEKEARQTKKKENFREFKENKVVQFFIFAITGLAMLTIAVVLVMAIRELIFKTDWVLVGEVALFCVGGILSAVGLIALIKRTYSWLLNETNCFQAISNFFETVGEKAAYIKYLALPVKWIIQTIVVIVDMIRATYKRYCPLITWES